MLLVEMSDGRFQVGEVPVEMLSEVWASGSNSVNLKKVSITTVCLDAVVCFKTYPEVMYWSTFKEACRLEGTTQRP